MKSEEADTHMSVHIMHASLAGNQTLMIVNVVVLDLAGMLI